MASLEPLSLCPGPGEQLVSSSPSFSTGCLGLGLHFVLLRFKVCLDFSVFTSVCPSPECPQRPEEGTAAPGWSHRWLGAVLWVPGFRLGPPQVQAVLVTTDPSLQLHQSPFSNRKLEFLVVMVTFPPEHPCYSRSQCKATLGRGSAKEQT